MTTPHVSPPSDDIDKAIRQRILERAKTISTVVVERAATAANDLEAGKHLAALGALDGIEYQIERLRSFLLLIP